MKPIETVMWSFATGFFFVSVPYLIYIANGGVKTGGVCQELDAEINSKYSDIIFKGWCTKNTFDPNASLFWGSEGGIIRTIMQREVDVE